MSTSFRIGVITPDSSAPTYNGIRVATREEGEHYGRDLLNRWFVPTSFVVTESSDPVNYQWVNGKLQDVPVRVATELVDAHVVTS